MTDHTVEVRADRWRVLGRSIPATSPLQAVIRTAVGEGIYRARRSGHPISASQHFRVPSWGQPVPIAEASD